MHSRFPVIGGSRRVVAVVVCATLCAPAATAQRADAQRLKVVVAVRLQKAEPVLRYGLLKASNVPLSSFDFGSAFADELTTQFAAATAATASWRVATEADSISPVLFDKNKQPVPAGLNADRLLMLDVFEYGIYYGWHQDPRFVIQGQFKFIDQTGKTIWSTGNTNVKGGFTTKLNGQLDDIQKDDQKLLKEGLNAFIESFSANMVKDQARKVR